MYENHFIAIKISSSILFYIVKIVNVKSDNGFSVCYIIEYSYVDQLIAAPAL
jgi:hypothetical protein